MPGVAKNYQTKVRLPRASVSITGKHTSTIVNEEASAVSMPRLIAFKINVFSIELVLAFGYIRGLIQ